VILLKVRVQQMWPGTKLQMIQVSDPDCLATETNRDMETLRELGGAMLLAAACRNDSESTLYQYGTLLDGIVGIKASWDGGKAFRTPHGITDESW